MPPLFGWGSTAPSIFPGIGTPDPGGGIGVTDVMPYDFTLPYYSQHDKMAYG
jgi:hypothetical protein